MELCHIPVVIKKGLFLFVYFLGFGFFPRRLVPALQMLSLMHEAAGSGECSTDVASLRCTS